MNFILKKKQFFITIAIFFIAVQYTFAIPACLDTLVYRLPDNSEVTIYLRGDEWVNTVASLDGYTLLFNKAGYLEYAVKDLSGDLQLSGIRAHNVLERTADEQNLLLKHSKFLTYSSSQKSTMRKLCTMRQQAVNKAVNKGADKAISKSTNKATATGIVRAPLILVAFQDKPFTKTKEEFEALCNQINYTVTPDGTITGSVHDYFLASSYGKLDFQVDVFGPFTLSKNIADYDHRSTPIGEPREMAKEAILLADADGCNFADYDMDNNGIINNVHIIFAGYDQSVGAPIGSALWSHAGGLGGYFEDLIDGQFIEGYSCSCELRGTSGTAITHIGTIAHELSHGFGLPDLYDADGSYDGTSLHIGNWDIMANGARNNSGCTPALHSAYCRAIMGWSSVKELSMAEYITMPNPADTSIVYQINTTTDNEYFLLENRQQQGWDEYLPASGLLIYHVDKNYSGYGWNCVNCDASHRGLYIKQAGGGDASVNTDRTTDPYPAGGNTEFTDNSSPNAKSWAGNNTDKPVTDITHNTTDRSITFSFMGGVPAPYEIMLSQNGTHTFPTATYNYEMQAAHTVKITNIGSQPTGALSIELGGTDADSFILSTTTVSSIDVNSADSFTVVPKQGLAVGIYTATVSVSGSNNILKTFDVSFTVDKANGAMLSVPTLVRKTHDSIIVNTLKASTGQQVQYAVYSAESGSALIWQNDTVFGCLLPSTSYYVYAYAKGNNNYFQGVPSVSEEIITNAPPMSVNIYNSDKADRFLQAWISGGILHVKGLSMGKPWHIYTVSGILIHQDIASADKASVDINTLQNIQGGIYIIWSGNRFVKILIIKK